jgi:hypothetical protein
MAAANKLILLIRITSLRLTAVEDSDPREATRFQEGEGGSVSRRRYDGIDLGQIAKRALCRKGAADCGEHCEVAGVGAEGLARADR